MLVVDDDAAVRDSVCLHLSHLRFRTSQAADGFEAIREARRQRPDVVLMDLRMPGMGGLEATRLMRESEDLSGLPVIVLTSEEDLPSVMEAFSYGVSSYLYKSSPPDEVVTTILGALADAA